MKKFFSGGGFVAVIFFAGWFTTSCSSPTPPRMANREVVSPQTNAMVAKNIPATEPIHRAPGEMSLFNGKDLSGWEITNFGAHGEVEVKGETIIIQMGGQLSGIRWTNAAALPKTNYEIELDAMKLDGNDFFCGLTLPVGNSFCTFIVGGWGGSVVGISSLDGGDASENDTSKSLFFANQRWYHLRVRVTPEKIMAWIDADKVVDVEIKERKVSMRTGEIEESIPLGVATYQTSATVKNIKLKTF